MKFNLLQILFGSILTLFLIFDTDCLVAATSDSVEVQIIHGSADPELELLDIYAGVDPFIATHPGEDDLLLTGIEYQNATSFIKLQSDEEVFAVTKPGDDEVIASNQFFFSSGNEYIIVINGDSENAKAETTQSGLNISVAEAQTESFDDTELELQAFHAVPDGPDVADIVIRNQAGTHLTELKNINFGSGSNNYFGYDEDLYDIEMFEAGADINEDEPVAAFQFEVNEEEHGSHTAIAVFTGYSDSIELLMAFNSGETEIIEDVATSIAERADYEIPDNFVLKQNYPNPFNPVTQIEFAIPEKSTVSLQVYNITGERIATLLDNQEKQSGWYQVQFDASGLSSGTYIYKLQAADYKKTGSMTLIK